VKGARKALKQITEVQAELNLILAHPETIDGNEVVDLDLRRRNLARGGCFKGNIPNGYCSDWELVER
jgi:hypothetical protein